MERVTPAKVITLSIPLRLDILWKLKVFFCSYNISPNIVASCSIHLFTHDMRLILLFSDVMRHFSGVIEPGNNYLLISLAITSEVNWFYTCFGSTFKSKIMHRSKCS